MLQVHEYPQHPALVLRCTLLLKGFQNTLSYTSAKIFAKIVRILLPLKYFVPQDVSLRVPWVYITSEGVYCNSSKRTTVTTVTAVTTAVSTSVTTAVTAVPAVTTAVTAVTAATTSVTTAVTAVTAVTTAVSTSVTTAVTAVTTPFFLPLQTRLDYYSKCSVPPIRACSSEAG